ncbi:hypothetical protein [Paenibacillus sp. FSL H7-0714]|uniref:hypothetical protein n=1 Tax=Paenibacillus sp. FSL H7-0714 TaxID=2954735 RepID=UPI0030FB1E32
MLKQLDNNFKASGLPSNYTLDQAGQLLQENYNAIELSKEDFKSLQKDPDAKYDHIAKCYKIMDTKLLYSIYTQEEKQDLSEMILYLNSLVNDNRGSSENSESELMWKNIKEGRRINIVLESVDNNSISSFTMQGLSQKILYDLIILKGIPDEYCLLGNPHYEYYLNVLHNAGKI